MAYWKLFPNGLDGAFVLKLDSWEDAQIDIFAYDGFDLIYTVSLYDMGETFVFP